MFLFLCHEEDTLIHSMRAHRQTGKLKHAYADLKVRASTGPHSTFKKIEEISGEHDSHVLTF